VKNKNKHKGTTLYCFSPPVMLATFTIESVLLIYTLLRYKMSTLGRLVSVSLALLAIFQIAEYQVCGRTNSVSTSSRIGFMAIAMLPPVGIHLAQVISGRDQRTLRYSAYVCGAAIALFFGFGRDVFTSYECAGNYAIFQLVPKRGGEFFAYYYVLLTLEICMALYFAITATLKTRKALIYQVFGVLSFLIPTGIVNAINPSTINGIPSVMCGFAVTYAIVLVFGIVPLTLEEQTEHRRFLQTQSNRSAKS
jgi:hypothetical protein